jgi:hypothetical protein
MPATAKQVLDKIVYYIWWISGGLGVEVPFFRRDG